MCYNNYNFMDRHGNYMVWVAQERIDDAFRESVNGDLIALSIFSLDKWARGFGMVIYFIWYHHQHQTQLSFRVNKTFLLRLTRLPSNRVQVGGLTIVSNQLWRVFLRKGTDVASLRPIEDAIVSAFVCLVFVIIEFRRKFIASLLQPQRSSAVINHKRLVMNRRVE